MPVKNADAFIEETLLSILAQSYTRWELIAIDDHSEDESIVILSKFSLVDQRIKVFPNQGKGIISALKTALLHSRGQLITRMDADDLMPEKRLEWMAELLLKKPAKTIVTGKVTYFGDSVSQGYSQYESWLNELIETNGHWQQIYRECVIASPNWMIRKADLVEDELFTDQEYPEDYHFVLKVYSKNYQVTGLEKTTLLWREHPDRTSRHSPNYQQKAFFELKINHFLKHDYNPDRTLILWGNNPKTKLTSSILDQANIPYHQMTKAAYDQIQSLDDYHLLVGVYPPANERHQLEAYLIKLGLTEGSDWWYL